MPKTIKYAAYDGYPTRLASGGEIWVCFDGRTWCVPSRKTQIICYEAGLLSRERYHQIFGHDLPPLPDHAFVSEWRSPLV